MRSYKYFWADQYFGPTKIWADENLGRRIFWPDENLEENLADKVWTGKVHVLVSENPLFLEL